MIEDPRKVLKDIWGFDSFRPLQEDIIREVLAGHDVLALMPTGGGKSVCFQVPAICMPGVCIVVSPLIALMKDQVQNLKKRGVNALAIFSGMNPKEIDVAFDNCIHGNVKLLYVSPERLKTEMAQSRIAQMNVNLIAVDEAHCISQWGYDFRPAYLEIASLREMKPEVPVLALTATATPEVVEDIQNRLNFKAPNVLQKSFTRSNLAYVVLEEDDKLSKLENILRKVGGSAVVYARTRRLTVEVAKYLKVKGIVADHYHAGLSAEVRSQKQDAWLKGATRVIVATNAFGMGIDKPDVRSVVHLHLPDSLEAYFQEAGRAGRDGRKSYAVLLFNNEDKIALRRNLELNFPPFKEIQKVYSALGSYFQLAVGSGEGVSFDFEIGDFCKNFQLNPLSVHSCLKVLEQEGWIYLSDAFYMPSTFRVLVNREQLYDFQLRNPAVDPFIKTLLRTSSGAFGQFARLNEKHIATYLKTTTGKVQKVLMHLHKLKLIEYRPVKEKPQLTFLQPRVSGENLRIDREKYSFRKDRYEFRIKAAISYVEKKICRSAGLLRYFGEKSGPCGVCDVCLENAKRGYSAEDYRRYSAKILGLLAKEPLTEKELVESFASNRKENVLRTLEYLLDECKVSKQEGKIIASSEKQV